VRSITAYSSFFAREVQCFYQAINTSTVFRDSSETVLNSFLLPQESAEGCNDGNGKRRADHKLTMLLNETRDVLERSPPQNPPTHPPTHEARPYPGLLICKLTPPCSLEFNQILSRCLNLSFYAMAHQLHSCFSQTQQQQQQQVNPACPTPPPFHSMVVATTGGVVVVSAQL
jgi:hypothetical protein